MKNFISLKKESNFWKTSPEEYPVMIDNSLFTGISLEVRGLGFIVNFVKEGVYHGLNIFYSEDYFSISSTFIGQRYFEIDSVKKKSPFSYRLLMTGEGIPF